MTDMVNHPPHYKSDSGIEANTVQKAFFHDDPWYWTVFKYMVREGKKNTPPLEDALKGLWYYIDRIAYKFDKKYQLVELQNTNYLEAMVVDSILDICVTPATEGTTVSLLKNGDRLDFTLSREQSDELVSRLLEVRG